MSKARCRLLIVISLVLSVLSGSVVTLAQDATPVPQTGPPFTLPFAPPPELCTLTPRTVEDYAAFAGAPQVELPPVILTAGPPPDQETIDGIVDTMVRFFACLNAMDPLRWAGVFTDAGFEEDSVNSGLTADLIAWIGSPHDEPSPEEDWDVLYAMFAFQLLPDGRVAAILQRGPDGLGGMDLTIWAKEGDRWLLDFWVDEPWDVVFNPNPPVDDSEAATPTS
ncbi:MAG: hypothetical protein R2839_10175 [Thermomicrobiales bacterium]